MAANVETQSLSRLAVTDPQYRDENLDVQRISRFPENSVFPSMKNARHLRKESAREKRKNDGAGVYLLAKIML
jgi:hypothetical protein